MARIDASATPRSHLPRPPLGFLKAASSGSSQPPRPSPTAAREPALLRDMGGPFAPGRIKSAVIVYSTRAGTTLAYIESMLTELSRRHPHRAWSYGVVLGENGGGMRGRVRVNGSPVDGSLLDQCCRDCELEISARFGPGAAAAHPGAGDADAMLVNVALRVFEKLNVTTVALAASHPGHTSEAPADADEHSTGGVPGATPPAGPQGAPWSVERLVMELHRPKVVVCGLEPLPAYLARLPEDWRKGLIYLTRHPVHIVSSAQPGAVRTQLHGLATVFGVAIECAPPLEDVPACVGLAPGIFGPEQGLFAALALAACQAWACQHGLPLPLAFDRAARAASTCAVHSPVRAPARQATNKSPQMEAGGPLHDAPQWMVHGLSAARCPGTFYTLPADDAGGAEWHYGWAETPSEYRRVGAWFGDACKENGASMRMLLIHLPQPVIARFRYLQEADGTWQSADYRELLLSLHHPLRSAPWTFCVFTADLCCESRGTECHVPSALPQYIPREFWADVAGLRADQIAIVPSLAGALQLIDARCRTHQPVPGDRPGPSQLSVDSPATPSPVASPPGAAPIDAALEPAAAPALRPIHLIWPSSSVSNLALPQSARSPRVFGKSAAAASTTSIDRLVEARGRTPGAFGSMSAASLPLRAHRTNAPLPALPAAAQPRPATAILVVGSRSFVQSALCAARR
ncbi:hypothetical protein LPJ61_000952 [Coemansia biformis]|uniref:Uncharacterized protein n=1 Tax=Coemansia biformis TaxID=1286918 RepID=A0A9W8CXR7_9FUNG|nr:hypothetical protein LPJ61_000952 [Coemansia biformis]